MTNNNQNIINGILANTPVTMLNPKGAYPKCKPALGSHYYERCGSDVYEHKGACKSAKPEDRFDFINVV